MDIDEPYNLTFNNVNGSRVDTRWAHLFNFQINGKLTLGENIADNGGFKASYRVSYVARVGSFPVFTTLQYVNTTTTTTTATATTYNDWHAGDQSYGYDYLSMVAVMMIWMWRWRRWRWWWWQRRWWLIIIDDEDDDDDDGDDDDDDDDDDIGDGDGNEDNADDDSCTYYIYYIIFTYMSIYYVFTLYIQAYKSWIQEKGRGQLRLPGLNVTNEQLFFIAFGQVRRNAEICASDHMHSFHLHLQRLHFSRSLN